MQRTQRLRRIQHPPPSILFGGRQSRLFGGAPIQILRKRLVRLWLLIVGASYDMAWGGLAWGGGADAVEAGSVVVRVDGFGNVEI